MSELLPITTLAIVCAFISHSNSGYDPIHCTYQRKERMFYVIMSVILVLFCGLRTGYNDTDTYRVMYWAEVADIKNGMGILEGIDWLKLGDNPGYLVVIRVMAKLDMSVQTKFMLFSIFYITVPLWFFRKYSCNLWLSILIYITFAGYMFSLAAIKQCTAMAFCLLATDRAINKKYISFVLYVLLGSLFHPYALMYLIVPLLFFRPWSVYTVIMLICFGGIGFGMQSLIGTLLNVTDMLGENYDANSFIGEGVHPVRLMVTAVPLVFSMITAKQIRKDEQRDQYVIVNLAMLNAEVMFVALFGTANYFARLANYFIPFQALSIPWLLKQCDYRLRQMITVAAAAGYSLFFYYSFYVLENFDLNFYSITLWEYLGSIFEKAVIG